MGHHDHHHHHHDHHGEQHHSYGYGVPPAAGYYPPLPPVPYPPPQPYGDPYAYGSHAPPAFIQPYAAPPPAPYSPYNVNPAYQHDQLNHAISEHHRHGRNEHLAEAGAAAAGAFAMYEVHEAKVDPLHAGRHKMEAGVAGAVALGSAAYAFHEHHEKKQDEHLIASLESHQYGGSHHGHGHHHHDGGGHGHGHHHGKHHHFW